MSSTPQREVPGDAPLIRLDKAAFGYRHRVVVENIDLEIRPGMFLGIAGPNGSGKTTLFRGILGLIEPIAGTVSRTSDLIGYVPQREQLDEVYPLTVGELVQMGGYGRLSGLRLLSAKEKSYARECLELVGLEDRERELFASLSGGQRQNVLIARALMARPQVMLLDEPTSGIDRRATSSIVELLTRLVKEEGLSVLLVTHQLDLLKEAADEVLWVAERGIDRGATQEILSPESLHRRLSGGAGS